MSAFLPLLFLNLLTISVLVVWSRKGTGAAGPRLLMTVALVFSLLLAWGLLLPVLHKIMTGRSL